jgi:DNA adenine methylase
MPPIVPPVKCQGIKTKLIGAIESLVRKEIKGRWIEPFCGSCVVPFNIRPEKALLCDSNEHIIRLYSDLQTGVVTPGMVKEYLEERGSHLKRQGESIYYETRDSFNQQPDSLAFLFLNRSCFNGMMRFNRKGRFNVPFCRKPDRFSRAYITKIVNQVKVCYSIIRSTQWEFRSTDFRETLSQVTELDFVYADPPYAGRHVDYYNSWSDQDEQDLARLLKSLPCQFVLSAWHSNKYRTNLNIPAQWSDPRHKVNTIGHFYHVGSKENLRHAMIEALITNYQAAVREKEKKKDRQFNLFDAIDLSEAGT